MPQTIIIPNWKKGGTLSQIAAKYGTTVAELQKANNIADPDFIREGASLIIPDKTSSSASLGGTLPSTQPTDATGKTLPETPMDQLSSFRNLLNMVTTRAKQEASMGGVTDFGSAVPGFDPSKISGGTLSGILGFLGKQKTQGIADIYKSTTDFFDNQQKQAQDQLRMLISANAFGDLTDSALAKLSAASGADYEILDSIRKQQKLKKATPKYFQNITRNGVEYRVGFDEMGNEITSNPTGADEGGGSMTEAERKRMAVKCMDAAIQEVRGKDGFISPDDWKIALDSWMKEGYSAKDFEMIFEQYKNPDNLDYPD